MFKFSTRGDSYIKKTGIRSKFLYRLHAFNGDKVDHNDGENSNNHDKAYSDTP